MHAKETTFRDFFSGGAKYVSPSFQRPYGWNRARCADYVARAFQPDAPSAFLGAAVYMDLPPAPDGCPKRLLIDGTHRIMTLHAILLAIRDEAAAGPDPALADAIQSAFFLHDRAATGAGTTRAPAHSALRLIVPRKDRAVYEALVRGRPCPSPSSPFLRAVKFAQEAVRGAAPDRLRAAARAIGSRFTLVVLALDRDEDPYPLFKLFNAPGEEFTRTGLKEYTAFAADPELMALVAGGESRGVEFKERTLKQPPQKPGAKPPTAPAKATPCEGAFGILRSVAGFMNSAAGGTLLVGVRDDGSIRGVEEEYPLVDRGKSNWDGYALWLNNMLRSRLSTRNPILHYTVERRRTKDHDVCMVKVRPASAPVYIDKRFYLRAGNQTVEMLGPDLVNYVSERWPHGSP